MIETKRIQLRRFLKSDKSSLESMMMDDEVLKYTSFRKAQDKDFIEKRLNDWINDNEVWAAILKESKSVIGWFMLKKTSTTYPELGFMINKESWGKGYATEISLGLIEYAKSVIKAQKVIAFVDQENLPSKNVLDKIGMKEKGHPENKNGSDYYEIKIN